MKHEYFKTRVSKGINTNTFEDLYMPQISLEKGSWNPVVDNGHIVGFPNKGEAALFCEDLERQNDRMDD